MRNEPELTTSPSLNAQEREYIAYYVEDRFPLLAKRMRGYSTELVLSLREITTLLRVLHQDADRQYTTYDTVDTELVVEQAGLRSRRHFILERDHIREIGIDRFLDGEPTSRQPKGAFRDDRKLTAQLALHSYAHDRDELAGDAAEYGIS